MSLKTLLPHAVSKDALRRKRAGVRKKYEARAIFRSMSFMMLVVGYFVYATFLSGDDSAAIEQVRMKEARERPDFALVWSASGCSICSWAASVYLTGPSELLISPL